VDRRDRYPVNTAAQAISAISRDKKRLEKAAAYDNQERICPCCGDGFPCCADFETIAQTLGHALTCVTYRFSTEVCEPCSTGLASGVHRTADGKESA
jgi:hypothetical protein